MDIDKRQSARKFLRTKAALTLQAEEPMAVNTADIGKFGMSLVNIQKLITMGQHVRVKFEILFSGKIHTVDIAARVAYCFSSPGEGYKAGLQFLELDSDAAAIVAQYIG